MSERAQRTGSVPEQKLPPAQPSEGTLPPEPVVRTRNLHKTFVTGFIPVRALARSGGGAVRPELDPKLLPRQVEAVRGLSLDVRPGEIFGLLGPNGSGKTTTIKMMMGLIFPTRGTIEVFGRRVPDVPVKRRLGYLPENPTFYDYLRADEFLELAARLCGVPRRERRARIPALLERVGLAQALNRPLRKFSKGMLQRIGLAQALVHDPDLVVLDEPLSGLDPLGRKQVRDLIVELREQGKTVLFSSHILSDVEMICDRVAILVEGRLRDIGPLSELLSARIVETELRLENAPPALLRRASELGAGVLQKGDRVQITLPGEQDPATLLSEALSAGTRVVSVTPRSESLEDLFVREAGQANGRGGGEEREGTEGTEGTDDDQGPAGRADPTDAAGGQGEAKRDQSGHRKPDHPTDGGT